MSRYNSFEDHQHDVQFAVLERRVRNLETLVGSTGGGLHSKVVRVPGSGTNYTSTSYVAVSGLSMVFDKKSVSTLLRVKISASGFVNVATKVTFGVDAIASNATYTDIDVSPYFFNTTGDHRHWSYERDMPDEAMFDPLLASGDVTINGKVKVLSNQFTVNTDDLLVMTVTEVEFF